MEKTNVINSTEFFGNEVSRYGKEKGYVDFNTLSKSFNHVLFNNIESMLYNSLSSSDGNTYECYPELVNGELDEDDTIFQWYIIDENGYDILKRYTDEVVYYVEDLDLYVWGVKHFGTSWDCVLTDIKIER